MGVMSCGRVRGWGGAAFPQRQLWTMHMGQSHVSKGVGGLVQMHLKVVSMCVLSHSFGFLDSHSHTGRLLTFSGESQPLQPNFCWSVSELQAPSGTETTSQEATSMNTAEQAATPSSLLTRDCSRVMEGYTPWASWTTLPIASCSLSWEKSQNQANGPCSLLYFTLTFLSFFLTFDLSAQQF